MKSGIAKLFLYFVLTLTSARLAAQDSLSVARVKSLKGVMTTYAQVVKNDSLVLVFFWSVNSEESLNALNNINANLDKWKAAVPFRLLAVCVDEGKIANRMRPTSNMNGWTFDVVSDLYGDLRRALHANNFPQAMILSGNKQVYEQSGYTAGSENYLLEKLKGIRRRG